MSFSDPVADMLTRIRNAVQVGHNSAVCVRSKINAAILDVIRDEGYIRSHRISSDGRQIIIALKYYAGRPVIENIRRISRPGLRKYANVAAIKPVLNGLGIAVISTSSGVMTDREARTRGIGGEILCHLS